MPWNVEILLNYKERAFTIYIYNPKKILYIHVGTIKVNSVIWSQKISG